jgi:hypothetical protein
VRLAKQMHAQRRAHDERAALIRAYDDAAAHLRALAAPYAFTSACGWTLTRLSHADAALESVVRHFSRCWHAPGTPRVHHVMAVRHDAPTRRRCAQYARGARLCKRFHAVHAAGACSAGVDLGGKPCELPQCELCSVCQAGFDAPQRCTRAALRPDGGLSFWTASGRAHADATAAEHKVGGVTLHRLMLCDVAVHDVLRDTPSGDGEACGEDARPSEEAHDKDTLLREAGEERNHDELLVFQPSAAVAAYLIAYSVS